jgi:hypothetical protein
MVDRGSDLSNEYDSDSESSASWESARSELDSDSLSGDETDLKVPKIQLLIGQIADQVTSLYDLSALLRRPMVTNRYISSTSPRKGKDVWYGSGCYCVQHGHLEGNVIGYETHVLRCGPDTD